MTLWKNWEQNCQKSLSDGTIEELSTKPPRGDSEGLYCIHTNETRMTITLRPHQQEALDAIQRASLGQIIVPTGGGKTLIGIMDAIKRLDASTTPINIVVVAPRILLANQLCEEYMEVIKEEVTNAPIPAHIHSGETHHFSTTKVDEIRVFDGMTTTAGLHAIYFTTYHSLPRLAEAGISVDSIYFDEAHNSTQSNFFPATQYFSETAQRCFFFTATPKHSATVRKAGMNDTSVYGNVLVNVPAPTLVKAGFIVPPRVALVQRELVDAKGVTADSDCENIIDSIDEHGVDKVLVCAKAVKQIINLFNQTDIAQQLADRGYSYMYISAKTGAVIDGVKCGREEFFETLNRWGKDNEKKFVVLHHSILSEGINCSGLNAVIFMRSMDYITISQTIGRVIRLHKDDAAGLRNGTITPGATETYTKSFGLCIIPVFTKASASNAKKIQTVIDIIFKEGLPAVSTVKR